MNGVNEVGLVVGSCFHLRRSDHIVQYRIPCCFFFSADQYGGYIYFLGR